MRFENLVMLTFAGKKKKLVPLEITCKSADCENDLHCFAQTKVMKIEHKNGHCRYCDAKLVDWKRTRKRNFEDVDYTFSALKCELWRHYYWHVDIDQKAINHAKRKGLIELKEAVYHRLQKYVGPAKPNYDGRQTPKSGNLIFYAQHATATCCRTCIEEWHGISKGQKLTEDQIKYFTELIMKYIVERMPSLVNDGERVAPLRHKFSI